MALPPDLLIHIETGCPVEKESFSIGMGVILTQYIKKPLLMFLENK